MINISIIGSFRYKNNYQLICSAVYFFKQNHLNVLTPAASGIIENRDDFVIFETDNSALTPATIQSMTIDKIFNSTAVYVVNTDGYIGRTTCYEIGRVIERKIPLFFMEKPKDIPICFDSLHTCTPQQFIDILKSDDIPIIPNNCQACQKRNGCYSHDT